MFIPTYNSGIRLLRFSFFSGEFACSCWAMDLFRKPNGLYGLGPVAQVVRAHA